MRIGAGFTSEASEEPHFPVANTAGALAGMSTESIATTAAPHRFEVPIPLAAWPITPRVSAVLMKRSVFDSVAPALMPGNRGVRQQKGGRSRLCAPRSGPNPQVGRSAAGRAACGWAGAPAPRRGGSGATAGRSGAGASAVSGAGLAPKSLPNIRS